MKRWLVWASEDEPSEAASMSEKNKYLGKRWETSLEHSECSHPGACSRKCESWFACKQTLALVQNRRRVNWTKWRCRILPSFLPQSNRFHPGPRVKTAQQHFRSSSTEIWIQSSSSKQAVCTKSWDSHSKIKMVGGRESHRLPSNPVVSCTGYSWQGGKQTKTPRIWFSFSQFKKKKNKG